MDGSKDGAEGHGGPGGEADKDVVTRDPLNVHTSWEGLRHARTPTSSFYTRNNHPIPHIEPDSWRLEVDGFSRPATLTLDDVHALPQHEVDVVLECAGNARTSFDPVPAGTPWRERAVGCASFRGARLRDVLARAGVTVPEDTRELVFLGGDGGVVPFERSLPVDVALGDDTLVATAMNGAPLLAKHGAPARLLVPGWYGVASVKWLARVRASATPFVGHYQTERYVYQAAAGAPVTPVREIRVNSLVVEPAPDARAVAGRPLRVAGWAWSGASTVVRVEVSVDGGATWRDAELAPAGGRHAWRGWNLHHQGLPAHAQVTILARAHDAAGNVQPERPRWNVHGYGYNAPRPRRIHVASDVPA